jgi:hypothetical protein
MPTVVVPEHEIYSIYTSGREHSLRNGFDFARLRVLVVPLDFRRFGLGSSTTTASAASASASTTADVEAEADVTSAGTGGGAGVGSWGGGGPPFPSLPSSSEYPVGSYQKKLLIRIIVRMSGKISLTT